MDPAPTQLPADQAPEQLIAKWTEPGISRSPLSRQSVVMIGGGSALAVVILIVIGFFQKDWTFYLGAVAAALAGLSLVMQNRITHKSLEIGLTTKQLIVGPTGYPLPSLLGFWLDADNEHVMINVELRKRTLLPISFLFETSGPEDARKTMLTVLPEVEPRQKGFADQVNRYVKL